MRNHAVLIAGIVLAGFFAYAGLIDAYFIKDDLSLQILTGGGHEFHAKTWFNQLIWPTERKLDDIFRPIPPLSWAAEYLVYGPDPIPFHLGNILGHCLNGVLLYWLVNRLTRFRDPTLGFWSGLLFVLYPLHGEAVLWMTQRFVVWGLTFYLLALLAFDVWLHRPKARTLALVVAALALATLTKELGITLPGMLGVWALFAGPPRPLSRRVREVLLIGVLGAVWLAVYFGMRVAIFGRPLGEGYAGWPSMPAYAADNRVFERLGTTALACLVPINRTLAEAWQVTAFTVVQVLFAATALLGAATSRRGSVVVMTIFAGVFFALAYVPTMYILYVDPNLMNSRFGYHLIALPLAVLAAFCGHGLARRSALLGWVPVAVAMAYALVLQLNLQAYQGGAAQVRQLQERLAEFADDSPPGTGFAVYHVPVQYAGCPTIDLYLPALMRPPFVTEPVPALPMGLPGIRGDGDGAFPERWRLLTVISASPVVLRPLFGEPEEAAGPEPAGTVTPRDGARVSTGSKEPIFRWRAPRRRSRFRLHLRYGRADETHLSYLVEVGKNATMTDGNVEFRLSAGDLAGRSPNPWPLLEAGDFVPPIPVLWRVETLGANDVPTGLSASSRLIVMRR